MTNVHPLSTRCLTGAGIRRVTEQLRQAHEAGVDLGSRVPHIHAAAETVRDISHELRLAVEALLASRSTAGCIEPGVEALLFDLVSESERLAEMAAAYPTYDRPALAP